MRRKIALLLSAVLTMSFTTVSVAAVTFRDINDVPWEGAKTYITKAADLGLMVGDKWDDGSSVFRARDRVTYCEATQLVYNLMKSDNKVSDSSLRVAKWTPVMEGYQIPEWAYQAISYALEDEVVSVSDLSKFIASSGSNNSSTREDVAVIFGKALSDKYNVSSSPTLDFSDTNSIAVGARPYIGLLANLGVLVGDENKNFNPKSYINRAEMAVITTRTYSLLTGGSVDAPVVTDGSVTSVSGIVNNITSSKIVVNISNGASVIYDLSPGVSILLNEKASSSGAIMRMLDNGVAVDVEIKISSGLVVAITAEGEEDTVQGYITDLATSRISIKRNGSTEKTYYLSDSITIRYDGETARMKTIQDAIKDGIEIEVTAKFDDSQEIYRISANISSAGGIYSGVVTRMTDSRLTLGMADGTSRSFDLNDNIPTTFEKADTYVYKLVDKFDDGTGLSATVYLNSSRKVSKIIATLEDNSSGKIINLTDSHITIKTESGFERRLLMDEDVVVRFSGNTSGTLKNLREVYEKGKTGATLTLNRNDVVVRVVVDLDEESYDIVTGTISKISASSLTVNSKAISTSSSTKVTIDGEEVSFSELVKRYDNGEELRATVSFSDNTARNITAVLECAEGKVSSMVKGKITLNYGVTYSLANDSDLTIRIDGSRTQYTFNEFYSLWFTNGNNYEVELTFDEGKVTRIVATTL